MKRVWLSLAAALPLLAEPNFSGNWMLNISKSQFGQFPAPEVMTRAVQMLPGQIVMTTFQKGAQGEVTTALKYSLDGKSSKNETSTGTARWEGEALVIESSRDTQGAKLTQRDTWTLSPDSKTLTVQSHIKLPNGEFDVRQVFEKVPSASGARVAF